MNLTSKEWQIIMQLCDGRLPEEIADATQSTLKTIRNQIDLLHHKFNVHTTYQLIIKALEIIPMLRPELHYRNAPDIFADGASVQGWN